MMTKRQGHRIEMIPIARITVLNTRARNKRQHKEIVDNIEAIGLKRPIKVSRYIEDGVERYGLICGEGRLDALRMLGETEAPAFVVDSSETECLVMSLVENIARRQHRPIDLMGEIGSLHKRGYNDVEIGRKIGVSASWVNMITVLLDRGEEKLVAAVETGLIPVSFAIDIARAESSEAQDILTEACAAGKIKGKKVGILRRLLDRRMRTTAVRDNRLGGKRGKSRRLTITDLMQIYQREADKQRLIAKKSDFTHAKLLFLVEALKDVLSDEGFVTLLRAEHLETMPRALAKRIAGEAA